MHVLSLIHEPPPVSGVFAEVAAEPGIEIEEWSLAWGTPPPRPIDEYGAVMIFGGVMHVDQEGHHPWLREENMLIQRLLDQHVPLLGVCLGGQLVAKAAHAGVGKVSEPEIGWREVELAEAGVDDPVLGCFPRRFPALQWHYYGFELPCGAVPLAHSPVCLQAFRLGERAWGIQFHAETTKEDFLRWIDEYDAHPGADRIGFEPEAMRADTELYIERWNEQGRQLAARFLAVAARAGRRLSRV
jgi:GMP synthase (glutamine-hydrolysing)